MHDEKADRRSINTMQAIQDAAGITIAEAVKWLSILVGCCWFWTTSHLDDRLVPPETPLHWLTRTANGAGWDLTWASNFEQWLISHPSSFWVLLAVAVFAAGRDLRSRNDQLGSIAIVGLLLAMSAHGTEHALKWFLGTTFTLCVIAIATDLIEQRRTRQSQDRVHAFPALSLTQWLFGPVAMLLFVVLAPFVLLLMAIKDYRTPNRDETYSPYHLGLDADELPKTALSEVPANVALGFLAEALLYAGTADDRKGVISALRRRGPTGAKRINLTPRHIP